MGTALSMNSLAEALGMSLPGCATIPAPYGERARMAYATGRRIVDMVREDLTPARILTREAFENAIVVNSAIGGSTNCPPHINAIARHIGVDLTVNDWETVGHEIPLLVNVQPAGHFLGEGYHRAGGVPRRRRRADPRRQNSRERADRDRQDHRRKLRGSRSRSIPKSSAPTTSPLKENAGLPGGLRQSVRLRAGEDLGDQRRFPAPLPLDARHRGLFRRARDRLRRA